jgi:hypothetical protein
LRIVSFSDALFQPSRPDIAKAVISAARLQALRLRADALLCTATHRDFVTALRGQGYISVGGNIHFFIRDPEQVGNWPSDLGDWWLTRGDGHSDETF